MPAHNDSWAASPKAPVAKPPFGQGRSPKPPTVPVPDAQPVAEPVATAAVIDPAPAPAVTAVAAPAEATAAPTSKIAAKKAKRAPGKSYKRDYTVWLDDATIADINHIRARMRGTPDRGRILAMAVEDWVDRKLVEMNLTPTQRVVEEG